MSYFAIELHNSNLDDKNRKKTNSSCVKFTVRVHGGVEQLYFERFVNMGCLDGKLFFFLD